MNSVWVRRAHMAVAAVALGCLALSVSAGEALDRRLGALSGQIGIWYFYLSTCPYCARQEPILATVAERHGITVTPISLDGGPPPGRAFTDYIRDRGQAARLGVRVTPTLYLVHPGRNEAAQLTAGLVSAEQLIARITRVAEAADWMSDADNAEHAAVKDRHRDDNDPILDRLNALQGGRTW